MVPKPFGVLPEHGFARAEYITFGKGANHLIACPRVWIERQVDPHADAGVEIVAGALGARITQAEQHAFLFEHAELTGRQGVEIAFGVADVVVFADATGERGNAFIPLRQLQAGTKAQARIEAVVVAPQSARRDGAVSGVIVVVVNLIAEQAIEPCR